MKKKVLVCGVTGFIGRNIAEYYAAKDEYEVYGTYYSSEIFENSNITFVKADLTNKEEVDRVVKDADILIQAAATTSGANEICNKPYYHVTDNAVMNSLIFRSAFEHDVEHVIFFSCTVMYQSQETPLKETDYNANDPIFPNYFGVGWTKVYVEKMCEFYSNIGNTKYTVLRHSNIYGPYDKYDLERSHVFGATITKVMTAEDKITVWGTGEEERDLLHVSDIVSFVDKAINIQENKFELFNVGYGKATSIRDLVIKIVEASKKQLTIEYDTSKPTIKTSLCLDSSKAKEAFGWEPVTSLEEGIEKTIEWYKNNII